MLRKHVTCRIQIFVSLGLAFLFCTTPMFSTVARADTFFLTDGTSFEGDIIGGTGPSLFVREEDGLLRPMTVVEIAEIVVRLDDGTEVVGKLVSFEDGTYEINSGNALFFVENGEVTYVASLDQNQIANPENRVKDVNVQEDQPAGLQNEPNPNTALFKKAPL